MKTRRMQKIKGWRRLEDMSVEDAVYLAALVDGEGCIDAEKRSDYHSPRIRIKMTDELTHLLCEEWGGYYYEWEPVNPKHKTAKDWNIIRSRSRPFLQRIRPYLRVKQEQADLALRMLDLLDGKTEGWKGEINRMAEEMRTLNK